jgi:hypothetical protein
MCHVYLGTAAPTGPPHNMSIDFEYSKQAKRWLSYFDRLGFGDLTKRNDLVELFCDM